VSLKTSFGALTHWDILALQQIEATSKLEVIDSPSGSSCVPTVAFLAKVQAYLVVAWKRVVTPTVAYHVCILARNRIMQLRNQFKRAADIAHWLHVNPFELSGDQAIGMAANIPRVQAQQQLADGNFNPCDYNYVYSLTLLATDDEQQALDARTAAMRAYMDQQCKRSASE
jgi:hypothetical protein